MIECIPDFALSCNFYNFKFYILKSGLSCVIAEESTSWQQNWGHLFCCNIDFNKILAELTRFKIPLYKSKILAGEFVDIRFSVVCISTSPSEKPHEACSSCLPHQPLNWTYIEPYNTVAEHVTDGVAVCALGECSGSGFSRRCTLAVGLICLLGTLNNLHHVWWRASNSPG